MNESFAVSNLKGDPKNPRTITKIEYDKLKELLDKFGDLSGVIRNVQTNELVGGHMRTKAFIDSSAQSNVQITQRFETPTKAGTVAVGYVIVNGEMFSYREVDWTMGMQKAANLAANKAGGEFDKDLLAEVVYEISQLEDGADLLGLTAFDDKEISKLLDSVGVSSAGDSDDDTPPIDDAQPAVSKLGEIYQLGSHRVMVGSSTDRVHVEALLNGSAIDLVFTDPPYGIDIVKKSGTVGGAKLATNKIYASVEGDGDIETAKAFWELCQTLGLTKSIMWGGNYFTGFLPFSDGWLVWDKRGDMNGNNFADGEMAWCSFHTPVRIYKQVWNGMIREGEKEARVHPTQKPVKMLADVLQDFSSRDDKVYDGFGGSGSTLMACEQMGRQCFMMELSPAYVDVIRKRYAKHVGREQDWQTATPLVGQADLAINQESATDDTFTPPELPE